MDRAFVVILFLGMLISIIIGVTVAHCNSECKIILSNVMDTPTECWLYDADNDIVADEIYLNRYKQLGYKTEIIIAPGTWIIIMLDDLEIIDYTILVIGEDMLAIGKSSDSLNIFDCSEPVEISVVPPGEEL